MNDRDFCKKIFVKQDYLLRQQQQQQKQQKQQQTN